MDSTLIANCVSHKSIRRKDSPDDDNSDGVGRNAEGNVYGEWRRKGTHASRNDPRALLVSKSDGMTTLPSYAAHTLIENRHGPLVDAEFTQMARTAEREEAFDIAIALKPDVTLGTQARGGTTPGASCRT